MIKRKLYVEHGNTNRWLVSYADFITLLFAFFVVMYAISSVNVSKYRIISSQLGTMFNLKNKSENELNEYHFVRSPVQFMHNSSSSKGYYPIDEIRPKLKKKLQDLITNNQLKITYTKYGIELELQNKTIFASGGAELTKGAIPILNQIAAAISLFPNAIHIEGYTDNVPIDNIFYPSNWDLSVARSATVVRHLINQGVNPENVAAVGYGEYQPIASNNTIDGRKKNRRVVIVITNQGEVRPKFTQDIMVDNQIKAEDFVGPLLPIDWRQKKSNKIDHGH